MRSRGGALSELGTQMELFEQGRGFQCSPMSNESHVPVVSGFHLTVQSEPSRNVSPGPGAVGMTCAIQRIANVRKFRRTSMADLLQRETSEILSFEIVYDLSTAIPDRSAIQAKKMVIMEGAWALCLLTTSSHIPK